MQADSERQISLVVPDVNALRRSAGNKNRAGVGCGTWEEAMHEPVIERLEEYHAKVAGRIRKWKNT